MADTSTPNPSDESNPGKPKLKLRKVSTSPLTNLTGEGRGDLLRTSQPITQEEPAPATPAQPEPPPAQEIPSPPPAAATTPATQPPPPPQLEPTPEPAPEAAVEPTSEATAETPDLAADQQLFQKEEPVAAKQSGSRRHLRQGILFLALTLVLVGAIGSLVYYLFMSGPETVAEEQVAAFLEPDKPAPAVVRPLLEASPPAEDKLESVTDFVAWIQQKNPARSPDPEGIFIEKIFFPVGAVISPEFGLRLEALDPDGPRPVAILRDASGMAYPIFTR